HYLLLNFLLRPCRHHQHGGRERDHAELLAHWVVPHLLSLTICDHWPSMAFARTLRHQPLGVIGILLLVLFVSIAVLGPAITPYDPAAIDLYHRLTPPSHGHWFGTDELGRDIFSRILAGARL